VIDASIEAVRPSFETKKVKFEADLDSSHCLINGDGNRLQQIFWNLFNNAVKFTPAGGHILVKSELLDSNVRISVTDSGIGISSEFIPYIFDRFRQADGSTTRNHGGLGLGLAIVQHLVELHRGSVSVESRGKNKGATFIVELPVLNEVEPCLSDDKVSADDNGDPLGSHKLLDGIRVLVVDDEADARELVSTILTRCGSEVRCSESAADAMQTMREWEPDVLVSDIGMPIEDGYSFIKRVRRLRSKRAKDIPAVALTAYVNAVDRNKALTAGFQAHLPKPIEPQALVNLIAETTGRKE
jgi:CheY-like chemotaxis protein